MEATTYLLGYLKELIEPKESKDNSEEKYFSNTRKKDYMKEHIIRDPETAMIIHKMMLSAHKSLEANWHNQPFLEKLNSIIKEEYIKDEIRREMINDNAILNQIEGCIILCSPALDDDDDDDETIFSSLYSSNTDQSMDDDCWTDLLVKELLRFLALKIMIDDPNNVTLDTWEGEDGKFKNDNVKDSWETKNICLIPSKTILDAWKTLMLHPLLYSDICKSMGSQSAVDFTMIYSQTIHGKTIKMNNIEKNMWRSKCYTWTLECYRIVFNEPPSKLFWSGPN